METQTHLDREPVSTAAGAPARRIVAADAQLHFVVNAGSGSRDDDATLAAIESGLAGSARRATLHRVSRPSDLPAVARQAARAAGDHGVTVAVGGDGTLNTVATAVMAERGVLGLVPRGTFNYFARSNGLPTDALEAVQRLATAREARPVQAGRINERLFLVNASLGLYPTLLEDREAFKQQYGRSRWVALLAGLSTLFREHAMLTLRLLQPDGTSRVVRTSTLFVGNNRLQMEQIGLPDAGQVGAGRLSAIMLRPLSRLGMVGVMLRGAVGQLGDADNVVSFTVDDLTVEPRRPYARRTVKIATDGEVTRMQAPLRFAIDREPLWLLGTGGDEVPAAS